MVDSASSPGLLSSSLCIALTCTLSTSEASGERKYWCDKPPDGSVRRKSLAPPIKLTTDRIIFYSMRLPRRCVEGALPAAALRLPLFVDEGFMALDKGRIIHKLALSP